MKTFFVAILATGYFSYIFGDHLFKDIQCSYYQKTFIQRKQTCSIRVSPLCASNNVTYSNSCVYCFANIALTRDTWCETWNGTARTLISCQDKLKPMRPKHSGESGKTSFGLEEGIGRPPPPKKKK
ncbi:uncharacterized protein LOC144312854 [Canis aureus]